jgi:predicted phosphohydrolase
MKIKAVRNSWGNFKCSIGGKVAIDFGIEWDARDWLSEKLAEGGFELSDKSDITMAEIEAHRARLAKPQGKAQQEKTVVKKYWMGTPPPERCDVCGARLANVFIDGRTRQGQWGIMHELCHVTHGTGLGVGCGQRYEWQEDGRWLKVGG